MGLKTITGKVINLKGIKGKGTKQWEYKYLCLYGLDRTKCRRKFLI